MRNKLLGIKRTPRIIKICLLCGKSFETLNTKRIFCSTQCSNQHKKIPEQRIAQSLRMKGIKHKCGHKTGGYRIGSTRAKGCWYQSPIAGKVYLDSSWELKYAEWLDSQGINWKRNIMKFPYQYEDKVHYYIPDFYLLDAKQYIQIKGYKTEKDLAKWQFFPHKLTVLMKSELKMLQIL